MHFTLSFPSGNTEYFLNSSYSQLLQLAPVQHSIIVTDENVNKHYGHLFRDYKMLIIEAGEASKSWETIQLLATKLAAFEAHKNTLIIGIGGGVVSDIVGFLASIYMRGVAFAFVPTSLLGIVDAAIGGKNGINVGLFKNMLGTIQQPKFILFDTSFLESLPNEEWCNGFAEIIKYACIGDPNIFEELLQSANFNSFRNKPEQMNALITKCVQQKNKIVLADEQEGGIRKLLNFGHTAGHAFETLYALKHGQAVALGMIVAFIASEQNLGFAKDNREQLCQLLKRFSLPTTIEFNIEKVLNTLKLDKKRKDDSIDFILLKSLGEAMVFPLGFDAIRNALQTFADEQMH